MNDHDPGRGGPLTTSSLASAERRRYRIGRLPLSRRVIGTIGACALIVGVIFAYNAISNRACTVAFTSSSVTITFSGEDAADNCSHSVDISPATAGAHVLAFNEQPTGSLVCQADLQGSIIVVKRDTSDASSAAFAGTLCAAAQK